MIELAYVDHVYAAKAEDTRVSSCFMTHGVTNFLGNLIITYELAYLDHVYGHCGKNYWQNKYKVKYLYYDKGH